MRYWWNGAPPVGLVVAAGLGLSFMASGCAEQRDPINRVQPNALAKQFFAGASLGDTADDPEFYTATTVVDVPYGADQGSVFGGLVGSLSRIKWEITETALNARLSYEEIDGVDGHGARTTTNGEVLASWPIVSHFDIRHGYNPATGEELNVIEENTSDRPWYEREYMRVDWSASDIQSSATWDPLQGDGFDIEPLRYYVNDPGHPDAPVFAVDEGYFDITNKLFLKPRTLDLGNGPQPACFYRGSFVLGASYPWGNCENSEITVRHSFRRVAQPGEAGFTDYEPKDWDGSRMNAMGIFTQDRLGWDRNYGIVDEKWHRFAQRYNIWQRSHADVECATPESYARGCDPERDGDLDCSGAVEPDRGEAADGTHDECEAAGAGSKCDELVGKCTLPFAQREVRVVPWHFTVNREDNLIYESTEFATWQWDAALRGAVHAARYTECVRTNMRSLVGTKWEGWVAEGDDLATVRSKCGAVFPIDQSHDDADLDAVRDINMCVKGGNEKKSCLENAHAGCMAETGDNQYVCDVRYGIDSIAAMDPVIVICDSPVAETDNPACGKPGTVARPGDIRYHQLNLWPTRQSVSPWGYGPSLSDPLTGEIISAVINVYNSVTDSAAQSFLDQVRWMNGEINAVDITSGKHVHDWVQADGYAKQQSGQIMDKADLEARIRGIGGADLKNFERNENAAKDIDPKHFVEWMHELEREVVPPGVMPENRAVYEERIKKAKENGVEAELVNDMWLQMAGADPEMDWEHQLELASPIRGMGARAMLDAYEHGQKAFAARGQCLMAAPEPTGIPALAKVMAAKFPLPMEDNYRDAGGVVDQGSFNAAKETRLRKMWDYLRFKMNYDVILHEMGHTVGLRHNFVSSYDKYNFKPQYWQLRDNAGRDTNFCAGPATDGAECVGPRWYDPLTQDEIDNSIWTWQQTTVMDYAGDLTQDMLGLGVYDRAAARMFYADVVDVRSDVQVGDGGVGDQVEGLVDYPGYLFGQTVFVGNTFVPYYRYNNLFQLVQPYRCAPYTPVQPAWWDESKYGIYNAVFDGNVVHNERCARPPVDYMQWEDMVPDQITVDFDDPEYFTPRRARDIHNRPRAPYAFLSDEYADGWSASAYRHDNGADIYEEMMFHSNLYENRHIFDNFRNGRSNFTVYGAYQRALTRYHVKVENLTQGFAYAVDFILREYAKNVGASFSDMVSAYAGENGMLWEHAIAAAVGFDHFTRVLTRPHTGGHYCEDAGGLGGCDVNGYRVLKPSEDEIGGVPTGNHIAAYMTNGPLVAGGYLSYGGKPLNNDFQYAHGYWNFDYLNQSGSYYEKTYAVQSMLNASYGAINFFRFDGLDARFRHTNFSDLFPDGMRRLLGVSLTEDYELLGPRISTNEAGQPDTTINEITGSNYPSRPLAWVSFVPKAAPVACSPREGVLACTDALAFPIGNDAQPEGDTWVVDPQLGYEVQKFIVFWYYVYQPGREMLDWVDLLRVYRTGTDQNPEYLPEQLVEWRDPESGYRYFAKRYGDEEIFGKTYDKGLAAKMIQWANILSADVYELDAAEPYDPITGRANVVLDDDGQPIYKNGSCDETKKCQQLRRYRGLLDFTRDTAARLGFPEPSLQIFSPDD